MNEDKNNSSHILERLVGIEQELQEIHARNQRVELDKRWETSRFRLLLLVSITYVMTAFVFFLISVEHFFMNACIPTIGYFLSTQSLPVVKRLWIKYHIDTLEYSSHERK